MQRILFILVSIVLILYPFAVYFGLQYFEPRFLGLILIVILILRISLLGRSISLKQLKPLISITIASGIMGLLIITFNDPLYVKLNPVIVNFTLLFLFGYTLIKPPSMIEVFARIKTPDLPENAVLYTRKVTQVWCMFFVFNIIVSSYTALYSSIKIWTLYNGLIAYLLMGILFAIEYAIRSIKIKNA